MISWKKEKSWIICMSRMRNWMFERRDDTKTDRQDFEENERIFSRTSVRTTNAPKGFAVAPQVPCRWHLEQQSRSGFDEIDPIGGRLSRGHFANRAARSQVLENDAATLSNWPAKLPSRAVDRIFLIGLYRTPRLAWDRPSTLEDRGPVKRFARSNVQPSFAYASNALHSRIAPII